MTEQVWNFPVIYATLDALDGQASVIQAGNEETVGALHTGQTVWEGAASDMWAAEQSRFNQRAQEFKHAVSDYINAVRQATQGSEMAEKTNQARFC